MSGSGTKRPTVQPMDHIQIKEVRTAREEVLRYRAGVETRKKGILDIRVGPRD